MSFGFGMVGMSYHQMDCSHFVQRAISKARPTWPYMRAADYGQKLQHCSNPQDADLIYFPGLPHIAIVCLFGDTWFIGSQTSTGVAPVKLGPLP